MVKELSTLLKLMSSPSVFSGVRVGRSLVYCVIFCRSLFVRFSFSFGLTDSEWLLFNAMWQKLEDTKYIISRHVQLFSKIMSTTSHFFMRWWRDLMLCNIPTRWCGMIYSSSSLHEQKYSAANMSLHETRAIVILVYIGCI